MQKDNKNFENVKDRSKIDQDLNLLVIFALDDRVRSDVPLSIKMLREMSIDVRMISGDHLETAKRIAIEAGIVSESEALKDKVCMTGDDLMKYINADPSSKNGKRAKF